jgi:peptidoglycan/xylan/chitin deacetylase (PgdA/CDA1 family)
MSLSIVMYHYVRDLARTRYPAIKGRDLAAFRGQLDYIARHHTVVAAERVVAALKGGEELPENAAWLTFDDGYSDHYATVFPLLHERGWQGSFFPLAATVLHGELLDVNRIHFILAAQPDPQPVLAAIRRFVEERQPHAGVRSFEDYWRDLAHPSRFDPAEVIFIKRVLQHALPEDVREELTRSLFQRFVSVDPAAFAAELYMTADQLRTLVRCGMYVGSHGARHCWLDRLDPSHQASELDASLDLLHTLGAPTKDWVMCYPYGAHNDTLVRLLKDRGCAVGLTTRVGVAQPELDDAFALPRLDTNDLPIQVG